MANEVILLDYRYSVPALRAVIALKEKGISYESKEQDLQNMSSLLLEMNPIHKLIPVLIHNGKSICESLIIVQYIDEAWNHKSPNLLPIDPHERAHSRFWADFVDKKIIVSGREVLRSKGEIQTAAMKEVVSSLKVLEAELGEKPYFGGDIFGYIDIALIPFYCWFYGLEKFGKNLRMNEECPKLVEWCERCMKRESVSTSLPNQQDAYDFIMELRKKFGIE